MKMIFLVDGDNNIGTGLKGIDMLSEQDTVLIFYQKGLALTKIKKICATSRADVQYVESVKGGKNSIDFQIITELGVLVGKREADFAYVISQDKGYAASIEALRLRYADAFQEVALRPSIEECLHLSFVLKAGSRRELRDALLGEYGAAQGQLLYNRLLEIFAAPEEAEQAPAAVKATAAAATTATAQGAKATRRPLLPRRKAAAKASPAAVPAAQQAKPQGNPVTAPATQQAKPQGNPAAAPAAQQAKPQGNPAAVPAAQQAKPQGNPVTVPAAQQAKPQGNPTAVPATQQAKPQANPVTAPAAQQAKPQANPAAVPAQQAKPQGNPVTAPAAQQAKPQGNPVTAPAAQQAKPQASPAAAPAAAAQQAKPQGNPAQFSANSAIIVPASPHVKAPLDFLNPAAATASQPAKVTRTHRGGRRKKPAGKAKTTEKTAASE